MKRSLVAAVFALVISTLGGVSPVFAVTSAIAPSVVRAGAGHNAARSAPVRPVRQRVNLGPAAAAVPGTTGRAPSQAVAPPASPAALARVGSSWTSLGPRPIVPPAQVNAFTYGNGSGRVTALAVDPSTPSTVYAGTAGGGVWKTTDSGTTWAPLTDGQVTGGIGAIAVDPSNPQIVYAGTGEDNACIDMCPPGRGILKTTNGGTSWSLVGSSTFDTAPSGNYFFVGSIAVDTATPLHVIAATNHGLYSSADGGATWGGPNTSIQANATPILGRAASGTVMQALQDPLNSTKWWAAVSDWCNTEEGDVMVSADSGATWASSRSFSDISGAERISITASGAGAGGTTVYAEASGCSVPYQSGGDGPYMWHANAWSTVAESVRVMEIGPSTGQGFWDNTIAADPANAGHLLVGGVTVVSSSNAGSAWTDVGRVYSGGPIHPDFHAFAFTPTGGTAYAGNDGGIWKTSDLGASWTNLNATLQLTQYFGGFSKDLNTFAGGSQDNGTSGRYPGAPVAPALGLINGGDGGWSQFRTGTQYYTEAQGNDMGIVDTSKLATDPNNVIANGPCLNPNTSTPSGPSCNDRKGFPVTPYVTSPNATDRLYVGTHRVWRSNTGGMPAGGTDWTAVSPDLTTGATANDYIATMAIRTIGGHDVVVTASQAGVVFRSGNAEAATPSWTNITGNLPARTTLNSIPFNAFVPAVAINPASSSEIWVTLGSLTLGRVWHTLDAGLTWTDLSGTGASGLPLVITKAIAVSPNFPSNLVVGTDAGAFICFTCSGAAVVPTWYALGSDLPNSRISQLSVTDDGLNLVAWTHGRGVWTTPLPLDTLTVTTSAANPDPAGTALTVTVTGIRPDGSTDTGYRGTIHITSTDPIATLPANYTFASSDPGAHTFSGVVLKTAGSPTVTATDIAMAAISGRSPAINVTPAAASRFIVAAPGTATANTGFSFSVTAQDSYGNTTPAYSGTIHFTSSDTNASLPPDSQTTNGTGTFTATLATTGNQTITGTDTVNGLMTGTSGAITVALDNRLNLENLGGILTSGAGSSSWDANRIDVFVRGQDGALYHKSKIGPNWNGYESLGGGLKDDPAAISWGPNRIDVFIRGLDNQLWHMYWGGTAWSGWEALGGSLGSGPAVTAWTPNRLDIFARGTDGTLQHKYWGGTAWSSWESLGGILTTDPGVVSPASNKIDIFVRGSDQALWHQSWTGTGWTGWMPMGGILSSGPDASSCRSNHLDVLVVGQDHALWRQGYNGTSWSGWQLLGGSWLSDPSAICQPGTTTAHVFIEGTDRALWHGTFAGS